MAAKAQTQESGLDTLKLWVAILLLGAGVFGFYSLDDVSVLYRALGLVGIALAAVALAYTTDKGRRAWVFAQDARTELRRVVWPTRTETVQTTLIVLLIVLLVGIFLWLLDMLLQWGFGAITGVGG
ncbi:preprotein translocase subunit SecE [Halofilum ochraceum]|jgi:preprotein translocase subunit SecE|uniref:preprotein translocase subunit SecE n=1 Tax=Halofilum ochraceum TaxID=1611323 RepID=UPI00083336CC|nr:preprotein translocase subunit SecE [Halofilum ochraceum]